MPAVAVMSVNLADGMSFGSAAVNASPPSSTWNKHKPLLAQAAPRGWRRSRRVTLRVCRVLPMAGLADPPFSKFELFNTRELVSFYHQSVHKAT